MNDKIKEALELYATGAIVKEQIYELTGVKYEDLPREAHIYVIEYIDRVKKQCEKREEIEFYENDSDDLDKEYLEELTIIGG